jgi:uncharacterized membrane protein
MLRTINALRAIAALAIAVCLISAPVQAPAQTLLSPDYIGWGTKTGEWPGPVSIIGHDSVTGLPCIVSLTASCALAANPVIADYEVSAANTAQTLTYALRTAHDTLSISAVCSAGTATVTVGASPDGTHYVTIDSIAAAASTAKIYTATTVGAATAISPLSFPYVQVTVGACGTGDTSTLIVGAK